VTEYCPTLRIRNVEQLSVLAFEPIEPSVRGLLVDEQGMHATSST